MSVESKNGLKTVKSRKKRAQIRRKKRWLMEQRRREQRKRQLRILGISSGAGLLFIVLVMYYFFSVTKVYGYSMLPTLDDGDIVLVNKQEKIHRYQLIAFYTPDHELTIRRVVGLPGEKIELRQGKLYINDEERVEFYLPKDSRQEEQTASDVKEFSPQEVQGMKKIPERAYYVLGDNRSYATDSRYFGPVLESQVVGVIHMRQPEEE